MTTKKSRHFSHHYELAFCGFSGSGKTTLIEQIISILSKEYDIGYLKHDAHSFQMDKEGKDTYKAKKAGAKTVFINNESEMALLSPAKNSSFDLIGFYENCDFVIIEGYKQANIKKILVVGEGETEKIVDLYKNGELSNVCGLVVRTQKINDLDIPQFFASEIESIANFALSEILSSAKEPIFGLVLGAGKSSRMGIDKASLNYHGMPQTDYLVNVLSKQCDKVFVSCREDQKKLEHFLSHELLTDRFIDFGPLGGILTAMQSYPEAHWLVVACDMPFIDEKAVNHLLEKRHPLKLATCYLNSEMGWPEPLFTVYNKRAYHRLLSFMGQGYLCPRKFLMNSKIQEVVALQWEWLSNANFPEDRDSIIHKMKERSSEN